MRVLRLISVTAIFAVTLWDSQAFGESVVPHRIIDKLTTRAMVQVTPISDEEALKIITNRCVSCHLGPDVTDTKFSKVHFDETLIKQIESERKALKLQPLFLIFGTKKGQITDEYQKSLKKLSFTMTDINKRLSDPKILEKVRDAILTTNTTDNTKVKRMPPTDDQYRAFEVEDKEKLLDWVNRRIRALQSSRLPAIKRNFFYAVTLKSLKRENALC